PLHPAPTLFCSRSLHDALPIFEVGAGVALELLAALALVDEPALTDHVSEPIGHPGCRGQPVTAGAAGLLVVALDRLGDRPRRPRSEEHTSELQSRFDLVCRLLL